MLKAQANKLQDATENDLVATETISKVVFISSINLVGF
jgi:hypothetical protein